MSDQQFILCLPYNVRRRIYVELDIIRHEPIDLSLCAPDGEWSCREKRIIKGNQPCRKWFTNQLFYVSRAVSEDSRTMFYAENRFEFARHISWGLQDIRGFGPLAWGSFRRLSLALDRTYHHEANEYGFEYDERFWERAQDASEVLPDWLYICEQLAAYSTRDDWLELRFSCDAMKKATAAAFLDPLKDLPRLKDLVIQMGPFFNPRMHEMVTAIIREKTRAEEFPGVFRFFDLPVELQYRILKHTDLIIPKRLTYSDIRGAFLPPYSCWIFSRDPGKGFCHGRAALPCLRTPHMLFRVSNSMRQLAMSIFYSQNVFKVKCELGRCVPAAAWSAQQSAFLHCFPKRSFHHLRHIHWELPSMCNWLAFQPENKETEDWVISLYLISMAIPPGMLTIELVFPFNGSAVLTPEHQYHVEDNDPFHDRVISYMDCLVGRLRDLFIHINYPKISPWEQTRANRERRLEQRIMGINYDSFARGKKCTCKGTL